MLALWECVVFSPLPCSFFLSFISKAHAVVGLLSSWRSVRGRLLIHLQLLTTPLLCSGLSCLLFWLSDESPHYLLPTTSFLSNPYTGWWLLYCKGLPGRRGERLVPEWVESLMVSLVLTQLCSISFPKGELVLTQIHPPSAVGPSPSGSTLTPTVLVLPRGPLCALSLHHTGSVWFMA